MQRWCCSRKVRQTSNSTTAREARTNGKGDLSWTRTWWISFADLIDMYLCTHMPKSVGTYQEDWLKLGHRTWKNDPSLFAVWIMAIRTVHIDGEIPSKSMPIARAFRELDTLLSHLFNLPAWVQSFPHSN